MNRAKLKHLDIFEAPFISVKVKVVQPGTTNGMPNIKEVEKRTVAPSANKIARYIVNQIFGSDLVTQTQGLNINWLMPTLKETLREAVYSQESFIYIHKFNNKIYLENIKKCEIFDLVQNWDKIVSGKIIQEIDGVEDTYILERQFQIENGQTYMKLKAYTEDKRGKRQEISIDLFNMRTGNNYESNYVLPYEAIINIDIGERFFDNSEKELKEEMRIMNIIADELEKTRTRIVSSQHYQSGDLTTKWIPRKYTI